jgi:uncharacterized protein YecT (DUF1311 family)
MKELICTLFIVLFFTGIAFSEECEEMKEGSTLASACYAERNAQKTDKKLNESYNLLMKAFVKYGKPKEKLVNAERAWIKYRDQQCELENVMGGINGVASAQCMSELTSERLQKINELLGAFDTRGL